MYPSLTHKHYTWLERPDRHKHSIYKNLKNILLKSFTLSFPRTEFYGFSEFWYTSEDVFKLGGVYRFEKFRNAAQVNNFIKKNQGDQMIKNNLPNFSKKSPKSCQVKKAPKYQQQSSI
jgi:Golgi nucleoside diphosphatase